MLALFLAASLEIYERFTACKIRFQLEHRIPSDTGHALKLIIGLNWQLYEPSMFIDCG